MFIKNADLRHPRRCYELFLPGRPYRGEPPTVAGFLLYPDTPAKMETTTQQAFCFRPRQDGGKGVKSHLNADRDHVGQNTQQESHRSHPPSPRQTGRNSSGNRKPAEDEREGRQDQTAVKKEGATEMQSQYRTDFLPPSSCRRRRTPALPQPDNIGINPAFRIEFSTVQRETYPGWPATNPRRAGRLRAASSGQPSVASDGL